MNRPIYIFTGMLDSGKSSAIKRTLLDPRFTENEKTLIICFEQGDEEYDENFLKSSNSIVEYVDFEDFDTVLLKVLDKKHGADRIFIEMNGTDEDKQLLTMPLPNGLEIAQLVCLIDASKFRLHVTNMPQFMFNHVNLAEIVVINRYEDADFKYLRANLKTMNPGVYINLEDSEGEIHDFPVTNLFELDNLDISDDDFGLFYMDVVDNFMKYKDARFSFNAFHLEDRDDYKVFGRYAMVCCANDTQRMAMSVSGIKDKLELNMYYHIEGILRVTQKDKGYRLSVDGLSVKKIDKPKKEFVSFN